MPPAKILGERTGRTGVSGATAKTAGVIKSMTVLWAFALPSRGVSVGSKVGAKK